MKTLSVLAVAVLTGLALTTGCSREKGEKTEAAAEAQPATTAAAPAGQAAAAFPAEVPDSLKSLAKLTLDSAAKLALARVPTGTIQKAELEREKNAVIWSFDILVPGQSGISEVNVNSVTGEVWPTEHENAATEKAEAREDSAAARRTRPAAAAARPAPPPRRP
jgi:uncharacterized membrane protein YkoI